MNNIKMYYNTFSKQPAVQVESELKSLLSLVKYENVSSYLEIGVARGDTFHEVVSHMPKGSQALAIDYPENGWGLSGSRQYLGEAAKDLRNSGYGVNILWGDSQYHGIVSAAEKHAPFDLVMIDGDHTYAGVKADWDNYGHMGRIVVFHDIADTMRPNRKGEKIEVPLFWNELKQQYRHAEFIEHGSTMGIGVIWRD